MCLNTYVECSVFKGNIWESQPLALLCFACKSHWLLLPGVCRARHPLSAFGDGAGRAEESLEAAERSKATLKSLEEFSSTSDVVCLMWIF